MLRLSAILSSLLWPLLFSGCAVAPLTGGLTASPLAPGALQLDAQFTGYQKGEVLLLVPSARVLYGLSPRITLGGLTELKTFSGLVRYSFLVPENGEGISLAALVMVSYLGNELTYTLGLILSARYDSLEPYFGARYSFVRFDRNHLDASFFSSSPEVRFGMPSAYAGLRYWLTRLVSIGGEGTFLVDPAVGRFKSRGFFTLLVSLGF